MTTPAFNPDDPRLTAFVLGEIGDSDRAEIEQLLETSPAAQAAVKEIEETIGVLKEGLASEPVPALTADQRAAVEEQLAGVDSGAPAPALTAMAPARETEVPQTGFVRPGRRFGKLAGVVAWDGASSLLEGIPPTLYLGEREVTQLKERLQDASARECPDDHLVLLRRLSTMVTSAPPARLPRRGGPFLLCVLSAPRRPPRRQPCTRPLLEATQIGVTVSKLKKSTDPQA